MNRIFLALTLILFLGCGYKPVTKLSQSVLGDRVYAYVTISISDPKNSVIIQDATKEAVVTRFGDSMVSKQVANSTMHTAIKSVDFIPTVYDRNGYVVSYKAKIVLTITTVFSNGVKKVYNTQGEYDFPIEANSVISDKKRFEAIKRSSLSALDEYIAFIAVKGMSNGKYDK